MSNYQIVSEEVNTSPRNKKHQLIDATVQLPDGKQAVWQYIKTRDVVAIVALDNGKNVWLVRQWRPARNDYVWELPAGGVEDKDASEEQVLENANRELQEEIGLKANSIKIIAKFTPTIHMQSNYYVALATDLKTSKLKEDDDENLEFKKLPFNEAYDLLLKQQTSSALNIIGMMAAKFYLK